MKKNKDKLIPNVKEILDMVDEKIKFSIKSPVKAKRRLVDKREERAKEMQKAFFTDFTSITFGDYINALHSFNREPSTATMDKAQRSAYFTFFAYEESLKRLSDDIERLN